MVIFMLYDLHTHSFHSDGVLSPLELINRAVNNGYAAIAVTDHVALGSLERMIKEVTQDCLMASRYWNITALPGVELTHLPPQAIREVAESAKKYGARIVVVHGETTVEPVPRGTNRAALDCQFVDILAHPGLITLEEAEQAAASGKFLELSARRGHKNTNKHVAEIAIKAGANLLVDSDAHDEDDLLTPHKVMDILKEAGISNLSSQILEQNPLSLIRRVTELRTAG